MEFVDQRGFQRLPTSLPINSIGAAETTKETTTTPCGATSSWRDTTANPPCHCNTYMLRQNIAKATPSASSASGLVRGIWTGRIGRGPRARLGQIALQKAAKQSEIDTANAALDAALAPCAAAANIPTPTNFPQLKTLPDPFTFFNGAKVRFRGRLGEAARGDQRSRPVLRVRLHASLSRGS